MSRSLLVVMSALVACRSEPEGTPGPVPTVTDTGWFGTGTTGGCEATIDRTEPEAGEARWYWRDPLRVYVTEVDPAAFSAVLYGPSGQVVPTDVVWGVGLDFTVLFDGGLAPDADHVLEVSDCAGTTRIAFHTDVYGLPLEGGAESLTGKTWQLDLVTATWVQPSGLGALLSAFFVTPILLGVRFASDDAIDLLGAPGMTYGGLLIQDPGSPTWDFPVSDFSQAPYVLAESDNVVFEFSGAQIPIQDFVFETTFSPDGETLGGTVLRGIADTRNLGVLISDPDPAAICNLAADIGTDCIPCDDGLTYCLVMEVRDVSGTLVPGLTLRTID